jgi:hypothetical protein
MTIPYSYLDKLHDEELRRQKEDYEDYRQWKAWREAKKKEDKSE